MFQKKKKKNNNDEIGMNEILPSLLYVMTVLTKNENTTTKKKIAV